ncbi:MAG TPA: site-specific integrase [Ktedonobacterales bacterium]|nr:site-specific integrase [Ktedonobacterales bacterium]
MASTSAAVAALQVLPHDDDPIESFIAGWLDAHTASARTWRAYCDTIESFAAALAAHGLRLGSTPSLVAAVAQRWAKQRADGRPGEVSSGTQAQRLAIVSSFYRYAARMAHPVVVPNAIEQVARQRVQAYRGARALPDADVRRRLAAINRTTPAGVRDFALLLLGLQTGRRRQELAAMRWADVEVTGESASITWPRCKGGQVMRDDLPAEVAAPLMAWLAVLQRVSAPAELPEGTRAVAPIWTSLAHNGSAGHQLTGQAISDICRVRLGTSKVHALRHSFAQQMEELGAHVSEIRDRLGHASLDTTRYLGALSSARIGTRACSRPVGSRRRHEHAAAGARIPPPPPLTRPPASGTAAAHPLIRRALRHRCHALAYSRPSRPIAVHSSSAVSNVVQTWSGRHCTRERKHGILPGTRRRP